jgi:SNF2 family DNA or RNA helicase
MLMEKNKDIFIVQEFLSLKNISNYHLSESEKEIVMLCDKYSEANILKVFSREKISITSFLKKYEKNPQDYEHILPFIDKYNYRIAVLLLNSTIPVFHRKDSYVNVYATDQVKIPASYSTHSVTFQRNESFLYYFLYIYQDNILFPVKNKKNILLSNSPCCMLVDNNLLVFKSLESGRLKPFFMKDKISIPHSSEDVYMRTFVKNTLKEESVQAEGFIISEEFPDPVPVLAITEDLRKQVGIKLTFRYGDKVFSTEFSDKKQVSVEQEDNHYTFHVFKRKAEKEEHFIRIINSLGFEQYHFFFYLKKEEGDTLPDIYKIITILKEHTEELRDFEIKQEVGEKIYNLEKIDLQTDFTVEKDWFDIFGSVQIGNYSIPFIKFRKHILSGNREYILPDKSIAILPEEWFTQYPEIFKFSTETEGHVRLKKIYFGMMETWKEKDLSGLSFSGIEKEIPDGIKAQLRPYQKKGFSWLVQLYENNFGGCLADDMGLGKTLQFLTFFQYIYKNKTGNKSPVMETSWIYDSEQPTLFDQPQVQNISFQKNKKPASLVVLPTSLLHNWKNEKDKFAPGLSVLLYSGNKRIRSKQIGKIFDHYELVFTTYGVMRNDLEFLTQYEFECIVLDESQYIKNTSSQIYQSVLELKAKHYFVATGTPIENSLNDLWAQLNFVNRDILGSASYFRSHFITPVVKQQNEERKNRLQQIIKPFILRRTKNEVAKDLPPVIEQIVYCEMGEEQSRIYLSEKSAIRKNLLSHIEQSGLEKNTLLAISALVRLRQLANHPGLVKNDYTGNSFKIEEVISRIENLRAERHKVLIFSSFVKLLKLVEKRLNEMDIRYCSLTGETKNREEIIARFQENEDIDCFLISLKAGGVGLNLMAADYVFILDPWWNPAAEMQAIGRAHRIGQKKTVMVYRFISVNTIEEKIQNLQTEKNGLATIFINNNNPFADMKLEDVENLFS